MIAERFIGNVAEIGVSERVEDGTGRLNTVGNKRKEGRQNEAEEIT